MHKVVVDTNVFIEIFERLENRKNHVGSPWYVEGRHPELGETIMVHDSICSSALVMSENKLEIGKRRPRRRAKSVRVVHRWRNAA